MDLLVIFLLTASYKVSGSPLETGSDLLNDVGSLEVQGYEVHEKLFDHKSEGLPRVVTTTVHRHSSSQQNDGSSSFGRTGEQKTSAADNIGVYEKCGRATTSENYVAGKEVVKIVHSKTNSHATPYDSVLSDSIKHSVGDDDTFTHKPIIVRSLTLSEVDNGNRNNASLTVDHYNDEGMTTPGVLRTNEESLSVSSPVLLQSQTNNDPEKAKYRQVVRPPYFYSHEPQAQVGIVEHRVSPYSKVEEEETVLHTTTIHPKLLEDRNSLSVVQDKVSEVDIEGGAQRGPLKSYENQNEFKTKKSLSPSMISSGIQGFHDHSATGDRINLLPLQPRYITDQKVFNRFPSTYGEFFLYHNGFPQTSLSNQFNIESSNTRPSYTIQHQPTLHHLEHSLSSPFQNGYGSVQERDEDVQGRGISNQNLQFSSYLDSGAFAFNEYPFMSPLPSVFPDPREEAQLDLTEVYE